MRRIVVLLATFAVLASGPLLATEVAGAYRAEEPSVTATETIVVVEKQTKFKMIDLGRKGESVGDMFLTRHALFDQDDNRVGRAAIRCVLQFKPDLQCDGVYVLRGRGDITFANVVDTSKEPPVVGPLTGGDGEFANITGQLVIEFQGEDNLTTFEIVRVE